MAVEQAFGPAVEVDAALRRAASTPSSWDLVVEGRALRGLVAGAEAAGVLDLETLDAFEAEMVEVLGSAFESRFAPVAGPAGRALAASVFGDRSYQNRLDRQLAVGASAAGLLLAEESFVVAVGEVVRLLAVAGGPLRPAWPPGSLLPREARVVEGATS